MTTNNLGLRGIDVTNLSPFMDSVQTMLLVDIAGESGFNSPTNLCSLIFSARSGSPGLPISYKCKYFVPPTAKMLK